MNSPSPSPQKAAKKSQETTQDTLYAARKKLYVRAVTGIFANWRWVLVWLTQLLYYGLPWLSWNDRQAVLFHLTERKFYIFGWVFWPQDVFFLALLLIISAYALFFFTAVAGRLWCGYTCPQTVYTEIFMWIEQKIEGDHVRRQKLDQMPMSAEKALRRGGKAVRQKHVRGSRSLEYRPAFDPAKFHRLFPPTPAGPHAAVGPTSPLYGQQVVNGASEKYRPQRDLFGPA